MLQCAQATNRALSQCPSLLVNEVVCSRVLCLSSRACYAKSPRSQSPTRAHGLRLVHSTFNDTAHHSKTFNAVASVSSLPSDHSDRGSSSRRHYSRFVDGQVPADTKKDPPWRMLFFGTDDFSLPHLQALNENRISCDDKVVDKLDIVVPTTKCAVGDYARKHGLQVLKWPIPTLQDQYDVGLVVSFGHLIPHRIINMFPYGILNVHPSLLPRWRGASPIVHTILNGDQQTGLSVMEIRPAHFDIGPLLLRVKYDVSEKCTTTQLTQFLASQGAKLIVQTLRNLPTLERLEHEQEDTGITYAHKMDVRNARLNWEMQTVADIDRQHRALGDIFSLRSEWRGHHIKLLDMVDPETMQEPDIADALWKKFPKDQVCPRPGIPFYHKDRDVLCVRCKDGWVGFKSIVINKQMSALDFRNGYLSKRGNLGVVFTSHSNDLDKYTFRTSAAQMRLKTAVG